ncbi:hypothetical protein GGS24DRAFT_25371 [Hypoxylon argillaceum]|nr:hypothetical protein GGS24DRAFT_25371 [Hypoxylon argillaceum]
MTPRIGVQIVDSVFNAIHAKQYSHFAVEENSSRPNHILRMQPSQIRIRVPYDMSPSLASMASSCGMSIWRVLVTTSHPTPDHPWRHRPNHNNDICSRACAYASSSTPASSLRLAACLSALRSRAALFFCRLTSISSVMARSRAISALARWIYQPLPVSEPSRILCIITKEVGYYDS